MIKKEKGITLVSLIITIILMFIVSSTVVYMSLDRFQINKINKMKNDLELLEDKVSNYYLKYGGIPVLRDSNNTQIQYTYTTLDFEKNNNDNSIYYIIDLEAMEGISLNYGKEGFKNPNTSDDVYIINEQSHVIYYVKGITLNGRTYHTLTNTTSAINEDVIPPSTPQIKVVSGAKNSEGTYTTEVELELVPGREDGNVAKQTEFSIDNGGTWNNITTLTNNIYKISTTGEHQIQIRSYDKNENTSENSMDLSVEIRIRKTIDMYSTNSNFLELTQSYEGTLRNFAIYGNSVQNGTPSPSTPVEVQSVGDKTNNLCSNDYIYYTSDYNKFVINEGSVTTTGNTLMGFIVKVKPNTTYTASFLVSKIGDVSCAQRVREYSAYPTDWSENYIAQPVNAWGNTSGIVSNTFTTTSTTEYIVFGFYADVSGVEIQDFKVEEGSTATEYEPYGKYKIPVKVSGKNLLNISNFSATGDGTVTLLQTFENKIECQNKQTKLSCKIKYNDIQASATGNLVYMNITFESGFVGNYKLFYNTANGFVSANDVLPTDTEGNITKIVVFKHSRWLSGSVEISDIQLEIGATSTDFQAYVEPQIFNIYLDEPLRKIDIYEDIINFSTGQVERNIGYTNLKGKYTWKEVAGTTGDKFYYCEQVTPTPLISGQRYTMCDSMPSDSYIGQTTTGIGIEAYSSGIIRARPDLTEYDTLEEWQDYMDNNDVLLYYPVAVGYEEIDLPELKSYDEYTKIEIQTEIAPSKIEATYDGYEFQ